MKHRYLLLIPAMALSVLFAGGAYALSPVLKEMEDGFIKLH